MIKATTDFKGKGLDDVSRKIIEAIPGALDSAGALLEGKMVEKIMSNIPPSLKEETIKRKGSALALVDTGEMIGQITHEVTETGDEVKVGVIGSRAGVAVHHEYGAPAAGIPERSFERATLNEEKNTVVEAVRDIILEAIQ